jgi:hypothetical protein
MDKLDLEEVIFIKTKKNTEKNTETYVMIGENEKITINLNKVRIPFGYENYNNKDVLNIELSPKKNNSHYNIYSYIYGFEEMLSDRKNIKNKELRKKLSGKTYYPNMRESKCGYIVRSYKYSSPEIYMMNGGFKTDLTSLDIGKTISNVELELGSLWISDTSYGFVWNIKKIEVLYSC